MEQEQEERQFTEREMTILRSLARDMELLAEDDLKNSGHPEVMFAPFRLMLRQMLEAGIAFAKAHPEAVEAAALAELREYLDSGWLDPEGVAVSPDTVKLTGEIGRIYHEGMDPGGDGIWDIPVKIQELLADALDTAYKAGAGAPPSHGSRFGGQPVQE